MYRTMPTYKFLKISHSYDLEKGHKKEWKNNTFYLLTRVMRDNRILKERCTKSIHDYEAVYYNA